jgi:hypothetical protein
MRGQELPIFQEESTRNDRSGTPGAAAEGRPILAPGPADIVKNPTVSLPGAPVLPEAHDVVNAVRHVEGRLGLPVRDVCEAADITRSTFYSWVNQEDSRPRLPSQGRLWALVQLVDDLEELLGAPPAAWLRRQRGSPGADC